MMVIRVMGWLGKHLRLCRNNTRSLTPFVSQVLGLGQLGQTVIHYRAKLLTLKFSRGDKSDADMERNRPKVMPLYERAKR